MVSFTLLNHVGSTKSSYSFFHPYGTRYELHLIYGFEMHLTHVMSHELHLILFTTNSKIIGLQMMLCCTLCIQLLIVRVLLIENSGAQKTFPRFWFILGRKIQRADATTGINNRPSHCTCSFNEKTI